MSNNPAPGIMPKEMMQKTKELALIAGEPVQVLDHGFVRLVDIMGDDTAIVQAARVSYGAGTKTAREDADLIRYLMRHRHTTPFEMCEIKLHIKMPLFVARQWIRHRTASINEYSCIYSVPPAEVYMPEHDRVKSQSATNKQGSGDGADEIITEQFLRMTGNVQAVAGQVMQYGEAKGVARELNRINMTVAHYTEFYWKIDLHNLLHFLALRLDPHAQEEIRAYAEVIAMVVRQWVPVTFEAFMQYRLHSVSFSVKEQEVLAEHLKAASVPLAPPEGFSTGEYNEFLAKIADIASLCEQ